MRDLVIAVVFVAVALVASISVQLLIAERQRIRRERKSRLPLGGDGKP
jgi:hypothetical protein